MDSEKARPDAMAKETNLWSGIDVAKAWFDAALWPAGHPLELSAMRRLPLKRFDNSAEGVDLFFAWCDEQLGATPRVVMESTGSHSAHLAEWMLERRAQSAPAIINPRRAKDYLQSLEPRNSTDETAARGLARYGVEREPAPFEPPAPERKRLRELTRYRQSLVEQRQAEQQRLAELTPGSLPAQIAKRHIKQMDKDEERLNDEIEAAVQATPKMKADVALLRSIFSVDWISASIIMAELGDLRRFRRARQMTAFAGLTPRRRQSGSSVRGRSRLSKMGSARVRRILHLSARCAINGDNQWAQLYKDLIARGKPKMSALGVIMRKILCAMRAILISNQPYQRHYAKAVENR